MTLERKFVVQQIFQLMKAQFYNFGRETAVEQKTKRKPDGLNDSLFQRKYLFSNWLFTVSCHQDFRNIMDPTHSLITKLQNQKDIMKFLVIWNVVIKTLTQFVQVCRSLWISRDSSTRFQIGCRWVSILQGINI